MYGTQDSSSKNEEKDYYKILNLNLDATQAQIKNAYRREALAQHPDKYPEEKREEQKTRFQDVNDANTILSDPETRRKYDAIRQNKDQSDFKTLGDLGELSDLSARLAAITKVLEEEMARRKAIRDELTEMRHAFTKEGRTPKPPKFRYEDNDGNEVIRTLAEDEKANIKGENVFFGDDKETAFISQVDIETLHTRGKGKMAAQKPEELPPCRIEKGDCSLYGWYQLKSSAKKGMSVKITPSGRYTNPSRDAFRNLGKALGILSSAKPSQALVTGKGKGRGD